MAAFEQDSLIGSDSVIRPIRAAIVVLASMVAVRAQAPATPAAAVGPQAPLIPAASMDATMKAFNRALGVECVFCHAAGDWKDASLPNWATARGMYRMVQALNSQQLADLPGVSCWSCHGGQSKPSRLPPAQWQAIAADKWPSDLVSAPDSLKLSMSVYSASLGVGCEFCHDPANWKSAARPAFRTAQRMNTMFGEFPKYMPPTARTQCYMCHKGKRTVMLTPDYWPPVVAI